MFRIALLVLAALTALPALAPPAVAEEAPKVLMIVRDGSRDLELMLTEEVGVMKERLEAAGYDVVVATESGEGMRAGSASMDSDLAIRDAEDTAFVGLALPCMAPARDMPVSAEVQELVKRFVDAGKPILAARGSVGLVAEAGGLDGKRYAYASEVDLSERPEFAGGEFEGTGVVRDGNVSTSGVCPLAAKGGAGPDGTEEVTARYLESLASRD